MTSGWKPLSVGIVGGGIGGLAAAIALRRAGHDTVIYERHDFSGEVGASISCAANGTRWLHEWGVDIAKGDPVILRKLINRDWKTGDPVSVYDLDGYEERWGYVYNMFHRQYMHAMLKDCAMQEQGPGSPTRLLVNHQVGMHMSGVVRCKGDKANRNSAKILTCRRGSSALPTARPSATT